MTERVRRWWWPGFVAVYPLLFAPWSNSRSAAYTVHIGFALIGLLGALILASWTQRDRRFRTIVRSIARQMRHGPVIIAAAFTSWTVVSAVLSPEPGIALTGSLTELSNGAYEYVLLFFIFVTVWAQVRSDTGLTRRLAWAVVIGGVILAALALIEVLVGRPVLPGQVAPQDLPLVSFPQKGHLAGMLALAAGVAIGLGAKWAIFAAALGIGLTLNRAAFLAVLPSVLLNQPRRLLRVGAVLLVVVAGSALGVWVAKRPSLGDQKNVASSSTLVSRSYLYRAALRGIAARPIRGWGGGVFELKWTEFLSLSELSRYVKEEWGMGKVLKVIHSPGSYPVLVNQAATGPDGQTTKISVNPMSLWHSHNQLLEIGLQSGLVGLGLYLTLIVFGLRGLLYGNPLSLGFLAYVIFLQLWFVIPETRGILWVIWAAASAQPGPTIPGTRILRPGHSPTDV